MTSSKNEMPGLRGMEHIGLTVPDMDEAIDFFVNVLGCEPSYEMGKMSVPGDWMTEQINVHPEAYLNRLKFLRCKFGTNIELLEWRSPDQNKTVPKNSDFGGHHLAFYVDDIEFAIAYLKENGVRVLGEPVAREDGPSAGQRWIYFLAPWGLQLELVSFPDGKAYEKDAESLLWHPAHPAK
jgi:catechol 2,3-dioxygenase-like lactoylglutathione lyase family enzyme